MRSRPENPVTVGNVVARVASRFSMGPAELVAGIAWFAACMAVLLLQPVSAEAGVTRSADALAAGVVVVTTLGLAFRRRHPVAVALIVTPVSIYGSVRGYAVNITALGAIFALGSAAYYTDRPRTIAVGLYAIAAILIGSVITGGPLLSIQLLVSNVAAPVLAVAVGDALRSRRDYAMRWRARAREIEELRDADQARAMAQQRVEIAAEVHDVVGHRLAAITVQARAAGRRVSGDERVAAALAEIDSLASVALAETRRAVGQIGEPGELAPTQPLGASS
jgi:signal transduction histidine kinase